MANKRITFYLSDDSFYDRHLMEWLNSMPSRRSSPAIRAVLARAIAHPGFRDIFQEYAIAGQETDIGDAYLVPDGAAIRGMARVPPWPPRGGRVRPVQPDAGSSESGHSESGPVESGPVESGPPEAGRNHAVEPESDTPGSGAGAPIPGKADVPSGANRQGALKYTNNVDPAGNSADGQKEKYGSAKIIPDNTSENASNSASVSGPSQPDALSGAVIVIGSRERPLNKLKGLMGEDDE